MNAAELCRLIASLRAWQQIWIQNGAPVPAKEASNALRVALDLLAAERKRNEILEDFAERVRESIDKRAATMAAIEVMRERASYE